MPAGRPRKTPQDLKLSGTNIYHPERKKWNTRNATPITQKPAPSRYLKRTQYFWNQFMIEKAAQNVLSVGDEPVLVSMFDAYDQYLRYKDQHDELMKDADFKDPEFLRNLNQLDIMIDRLFKQWTSLALRFGLTPTERSKLAVTPEKPQSAMLELIQRAKEG